MLKKLQCLANCFGSNNDTGLVNEQMKVWRDYQQVLAEEELLKFQKSIAKWLKFGNCNTKFFHGVASVKRRRNKVDTIQDDDGVLAHRQMANRKVCNRFLPEAFFG